LDKFKKALTEGSNWLVICFLATLYTAMGLMTFEDGTITLKNFGNFAWLDWVLWGVMTFTPAILALLIKGSFKQEGIKQGKTAIAAYVTDYQLLLHVDKKIKVRGEKEFLTQGAVKDSLQSFIMTLTLSFVAGELFLNINSDGIFKIIINLSIWAVLGFQAFGKHYQYAVTELKEWYIIETGRLKDQKIRENKEREAELQLAVKVAEQGKDLEISRKNTEITGKNTEITELKNTIKELRSLVKKDVNESLPKL